MSDGSGRGVASPLLGAEAELKGIGPETIVLVTGGTGFIGANLVRALLARGATVHLLVRAASNWSRLASVRSQLTAHDGSLLDAPGITALFRQVKPDVCFHLASYGSSSWQNDAPQIAELTCMGIVNLLNAAVQSGCKMVVNAGTSSEYGLKKSPPAEDSPLDPDSHYAAAKAFATHWCRVTARTQGIHAPTLRIYSAYGPYESPKRFIAALIIAGRTGAFPPLVSPDTARDFVHVDDVVDAFVAIAERLDLPADGVYNVGTGTQTTIAQAVTLAGELFEIHVSPEWGTMKGRQWDTDIWVADPERLKRLISWHPRPFRLGLVQTAAWPGWGDVSI